MTTAIVLFLAFGACFGLATFSNRHLFSEGPARPSSPSSDPQARDGNEQQRGQTNDVRLQRVIWVLVCSGLWPLMALTGLLSLWKQRRASARDRRDSER